MKSGITLATPYSYSIPKNLCRIPAPLHLSLHCHGTKINSGTLIELKLVGRSMYMLSSQSSVMDLIHAALIIPKICLSTGKRRIDLKSNQAVFRKTNLAVVLLALLPPLVYIFFFTLISILFISLTLAS